MQTNGDTRITFVFVVDGREVDSYEIKSVYGKVDKIEKEILLSEILR